MSDPQLRRDINQLQVKLRDANAKIAELEASPPTEVVRTVVKEVPVVETVVKEVPVDRRVVVKDTARADELSIEVKRLKSLLASKPKVEINNVEVAVPVDDGEVIAALKEEIKALKSSIRTKPKTVIKEKQAEAEVVYVDRVITEYVKDPAQADLIKRLREKLASV